MEVAPPHMYVSRAGHNDRHLHHMKLMQQTVLSAVELVSGWLLVSRLLLGGQEFAAACSCSSCSCMPSRRDWCSHSLAHQLTLPASACGLNDKLVAGHRHSMALAVLRRGASLLRCAPHFPLVHVLARDKHGTRVPSTSVACAVEQGRGGTPTCEGEYSPYYAPRLPPKKTIFRISCICTH